MPGRRLSKRSISVLEALFAFTNSEILLSIFYLFLLFVNSNALLICYEKSRNELNGYL